MDQRSGTVSPVCGARRVQPLAAAAFVRLYPLHPHALRRLLGTGHGAWRADVGRERSSSGQTLPENVGAVICLLHFCSLGLRSVQNGRFTCEPPVSFAGQIVMVERRPSLRRFPVHAAFPVVFQQKKSPSRF